MIHKTKFFDNLEKLIAENGVFIERKSGTCHPKYPDFVYIVDYGYIRGTQSQDGNEIDIFVGTCNNGENLLDDESPTNELRFTEKVIDIRHCCYTESQKPRLAHLYFFVIL